MGEISASFILVGKSELEIHLLKMTDNEEHKVVPDSFKNTADNPSCPTAFLELSFDIYDNITSGETKLKLNLSEIVICSLAFDPIMPI